MFFLFYGDANLCSSTIGERAMANLDHMCLDNQSHYVLHVTELLSDLNESQSRIVDTIEMNEKYSKSTSDAKVSKFSPKNDSKVIVSWQII